MIKDVLTNPGFIGGLEQGLGEVLPVIADINPELRLRLSVCGLASVAVKEYMEGHGYDVTLLRSRPHWSFDPRMEHVFPVMKENGRFVAVDTTYTQFLDYVGLNVPYVLSSGVNAFPEQKVASFPLSDSRVALRQLTISAANFQTINTHPLNNYGFELGHGPLEFARRSVMHRAFRRIWDEMYLSLFEPSTDLQTAGKELALFVESSMSVTSQA